MTRAALVAVVAGRIGTAAARRARPAPPPSLPTAGRAAAPADGPTAGRTKRRKQVLLLLARACMAAVMTRPTSPSAFRVPRPDGRYGPEEGEALSLLLLGDSLAAGVGVRSCEETTGAQLATALVQATGRPVNLRVGARPGATTRSVRTQSYDATGPGLAVVIVGGNDVLLPVRLSRSARRLGALVTRLRHDGWAVAAVTCPDYAAATGVRPWIHTTAARRSRRLARLQQEAAQDAGAHVIPLSADIFLRNPADMFSEDGCHPSARGYAAQITHCLPAVLEALPVRPPH
ncbi:GDSL-type esterase/lipase family protein [Streptomyces mashuensis]|nr:GDSL-type esterase/lipase family protein [Streptomyces mashuensis]